MSTKAGATALETLLASLSGLSSDTVQIGVPKGIGPSLYAYVTAASQGITKKATGVTARDPRYNCTLAYRVDDAESTAETTLMDLLDAFVDAINADLTLGGVCSGAEIDLSLADSPLYFIHQGKEFREYPILVTLRQYGAFTPAP